MGLIPVNIPNTAERVFPAQGYTPGVQADVEIKVPASDVDVTVTETPPHGWEITNVDVNRVSKGGDIVDGSITWTVIKRSGVWTVRYGVRPPGDASGDAVFAGEAGGAPIGGMDTMALGPMEPLGIFENHLDVHTVPPGEASYDPVLGEYVLLGSGVGNRGANGHFAYRSVEGPFSIEAKIRAEPEGAGWGAALSVDDQLVYETPYYTAWMSLDGRAWTEWVDEWGAAWSGSDRVPAFMVEGHLKIERDGDELSSYYRSSADNQWYLMDQRNMAFEDPVYVGLSVWSNVVDEYVTGYFTDVKLTLPEPTGARDWELHR